MESKTNKQQQHILTVTECQGKLTWSIDEISTATGLSKNFLRYEIKRNNLPIRKFGRRVLIRNEDLLEYIANGSLGSKQEQELALG